MGVSYMNPVNLMVSTPKEATGLASYTVTNESYFLETLNFITEMNAEFNKETKTFYRTIAESGNDSQIINESFSSFFKAVKKLIDKFIAFIKRLVAKFITFMNSLVKSDKYLIKHKEDFRKFGSKHEFTFDGYTYTFDVAVPVINALAEFEGDDVSGTPGKDFFDQFTDGVSAGAITKEKADKIAENIAKKYQELTDSLNGDYYDIFRAKVLNQEGFIPQEDFAAECFSVFRDGTSDKDPIDVTSTYISMIYARFVGSEKYYSSVEKDKKRIEKEYTSIKKSIDKLINANYDNKVTAVIQLPGNGGTIEASKAQELLHQMDLFVKAKSVQVQEMSNIHAIAFSYKLDAIKEAYTQDKSILYKSLSKIQGTVSEGVDYISSDIIEDDLLNDYIDPVDDQEIIDAIIDGKVSYNDTFDMVKEAYAFNEAIGLYKNINNIKSVKKCDALLTKANKTLSKFESNYEWFKGLSKEEQTKEINKKKFERFALIGLSMLPGLGLVADVKYALDNDNADLPAGILRDPDAFYRSNIAALKGYISDLEKKKKELEKEDKSKKSSSYENEAANFNYLQNRAWEQYTLEQAICESLAIAEGTDAYQKIRSINEGAFDKVKEGFKKVIEFIKQIFAKFVATLDQLIQKDSEYLKKYKDIILKKPLKDATYTMPNYPQGIKNLVSIKVPLFNYQQMKDEWLVDDNKFCEKVFQGKTPAPLASQEFGDNCRMIFRGSEKNNEYKSSDLNMTDIYNYCLEYEKMKKTIESDMKTITNSQNSIDKLIDELEKEYKTGDNTKQNNQPKAEGDNKNESTYSFLYGTYIHEDDKEEKAGGVSITPSAETGDKGGTTAAQNTQNIDKDSKADDKESLKNNAANKSELDEIRKKLSVYSSCCSTLFSTKLSIAQEIYKAYMQIITNHVKNYVGTSDKSSKTKDAGTDYSNNGEGNNEEQSEENKNQSNNKQKKDH